MEKIILKGNISKKLVIFVVFVAMVIAPLTTIATVHSGPRDNSLLDHNLLLPTEKNSIKPGPINMAYGYDANIALGASYLMHAQADKTNDNALNGADPGDLDPDDGGWDWNLPSGTYTHSAAASPQNIYGETALGLYYAYRATQLNSITPDPRYMIAMTDAANFMVSTGTNPPRSASDLIFLMLYDDLPSVCGTSYQAAAKAKYDARITSYGSALALAQSIGNARAGSGYDNGIIPWDISGFVKAAAMLDARYGGYAADAVAMANYLYDDSFLLTPGYFDVYGADQGYDPSYSIYDYYWYTSGVTGLIDSFDAAHVHTGEIPGLLLILLACQCPSGGFSYQYGGIPTDEDWQMTALAVITLGNYDASAYMTQIQAACAWLASPSQQDPINGCWDYGAPYGHYPQVGGECVAALYFDGPVINLNTNEVFWSIQAAIDDLDTLNGHTIEVQPGTYKGNILVYKEVTIQSSAGNATTIIDASQIDVCNYKNQWCKGISYTWAQTWDPGLLKNGFDIWSDHVVIDGFKVINALWPTQYNRGIGILIGSIWSTYAGFIPWNIDQWGGIIPNYDCPTPTGVIIKHNYIDGASDGIYNWASSGNIIEYNTVVNSVAVGGAGIQCYEGGTNNIIRGNTITNCDGAGISVGGVWMPNPDDGLLDISNTQIYDNVITSCTIGIQFYNADGSGSSAHNNNILNNYIGIYVGDSYGGTTVATAHDNNIVGNSNGVINNAVAGPFIATCNWWGDASGPGPIALGSGDPVSTNVAYCPWLNAASPDGDCISLASAHCQITDADFRTGPFYIYPRDGYTIDLCNVCSFVVDCGGAPANEAYITYSWDFGDGTPLVTTKCPGPHTYVPDCQGEGGMDFFVVTMTVTYDDGTTFVTCSDTTLVICYCADNDPPIAQLIAPAGGETFSGTVPISWFALDSEMMENIPIRLYYQPAGGASWMQIGGVMNNNIDQTHGAYEWSISGIADSSYVVKLIATDDHQNTVTTTSKPFTINNGIVAGRISDVRITDTTTSSDNLVKDGDTVEITVAITGVPNLKSADIKADLSGLGKGSSVMAKDYDGFIATWVVTDVTCTPSDGEILVTITTADDSNTGMITADNTKPTVNLVKPQPGLYLHNMRLIPLPRTVVFGSITIELDVVGADVSKAEFYVDVLDANPEGVVEQAPFSWTLDYKLQGLHSVKIRVYDLAGNMDEQSLDLNIFNPQGRPQS